MRLLVLRRLKALVEQGNSWQTGFRLRKREAAELSWPPMPVVSQRFPVRARDAGLPENLAKQLRTNVPLVRIGNADSDGSLLHELMLTPGKGPLVAQAAQVIDEVCALDWPEAGH